MHRKTERPLVSLMTASTRSPDAPRIKCALGVVIINFRTAELVENCLTSLAGELGLVDARVVVVDNLSGDGSAERIESFLKDGAPWKERVTLIRSKTNSGFSGGNNQGVAALDAEHYLLLNSDTLVREGALPALIAVSAREPSAGVIAPRLEDEDGTPQQSAFRFITPLSEFLAAAETAPLDKLFARAVVAMPAPNRRMICNWASFAAVLLKRKAIEDAGPMDEGYFMYFEDADYCRALKKKGWSVVYDPSARIVHLRGGSSPVKASMKAKKRTPAYYYAARTRWFRKSCGPAGLFLANIMWTAGRGIAYLRALFGKKPPLLCENQARDQWMNWRTPLGDRRAPQ